jgi:hypothetical protein
MQMILSLVALVACMSLSVESQVLADVKSNNFNALQELVNPSWRHHRSRLRPFVNVAGSPFVSVRGARSVDNQQPELKKDTKRAECIVTDEIITCFGLFNKKQEVVSCDVQMNFQNTQLNKVEHFTLSELRIMSTGEKNAPMTKLYMYGQIGETTMVDYRQKDTTTDNRSIFSLHSKADALSDKGLSVTNPECWSSMIKFFKALENVEKVTVQKESVSMQHWSEETPVIANVRII